MSACEKCWDQAVRMAKHTGSETVVHYVDLLAKNEGKDGHTHAAGDGDQGDTER